MILFVLSVHTGYSQLRTGLLVGGGLGFERNLSPNLNNPLIFEEIQNGVKFLSEYQFNLMLGYRFRMENRRYKKWFYDVDPLINAKVFKSTKEYYTNGVQGGSVIAHDMNLSFAVFSSINYKLVKGLYAGIGVEPTWYIASEGKAFDIPLLWKIGYNVNNKIDFAINYRLGFTNSVDSKTFQKGQISDLNISVFIPFTLKED